MEQELHPNAGKNDIIEVDGVRYQRLPIKTLLSTDKDNFLDVAEKYGMDLETVKKYLRPEDVKEQVIREKAVKVVADSAVAVAPAEEKAELEAEGEVVEKKPAKKFFDK